MRPLRLLMGTAFAALAGLAGCGTVHNLKSPSTVDPSAITMGLPCTCTPFGGVLRSGMLGLGGTQVGGASILFGDISDSSVSLLALGILAWPDVPLSLVGDVITYPVAYARSKGEPWATWWGECGSTGETKTCPFMKALSPSVPTLVPDPTPTNGTETANGGR